MKDADKAKSSGRAAYKGRDRSRPLKLLVTGEERAAVLKRAAAAGLSTASFLRAAALDKPVRSALDHTAVDTFTRAAGNLGALVEQLGLLMAESPKGAALDPSVRRLLRDALALQEALAGIVGRV